MATVQVGRNNHNTYNCVVIFKHKGITYKVDYELTLSTTLSSFLIPHQRHVRATIDFDKMALRLLTVHAGISKPKQELVDEIADALQEELPEDVEWSFF